MIVELEKYSRFLQRYYGQFSEYLVSEYGWVTEAPNLAAQVADTVLNIHELKKLDQGEGAPTIVVPGFGVSNGSTLFFRKILNDRGHNLIPWVIPANHGFSQEHINATKDQVKDITDQYGEPVHLVGQSLGGCYVRSIANDMPDHVKSVVTLGSPINGIEKIDPLTRERYDKVVGFMDASIIHHTEFIDTFINNHPEIPTTSIFSEIDGVVDWELSVIPESNLSENVKISAGHFSMGFSLDMLKILANRLTQNKENWYKWAEHQG